MAIQDISQALGELPDMEIKFVQDQTALGGLMGTSEAPLVIEIQGSGSRDNTGTIRSG